MWQNDNLDDFLQLIVQHQHKGAAHASEHIGPGSLEESLATFIACNLTPTVNGPGVHDVRWGGQKRSRYYTMFRVALILTRHIKATGMKQILNLKNFQRRLTSFTPGLHHHTSTDSVEGVWGQASNGCHSLCNHPAHQYVGVLGVWKHTCKKNRS